MCNVLRVATALALLVLSARSTEGREWVRVRPRIPSGVRTLSRAEAAALLRDFCQGAVTDAKSIGLTCTTRTLGPAFSDIVDSKFYPEGVIYGHFLAPDSEDAVVSGRSAETDPYLWSGTLLLTKRDGVWKPLWYKSAVLTHSCAIARMPGGREVLLCEAENAGMGYVLHYVFPVDLTAPTIRQKSLAVSESFTSSCVLRRQEIEHVAWDDRTRLLVIAVRTPEWRRISAEICAGDPGPKRRPPLIATHQYLLTDSGFRAVDRKLGSPAPKTALPRQ